MDMGPSSPAGPENPLGSASGPEPEPEEEWEGVPELALEAEEGVPNIFDESPKGKSNRKK
jgi:hypothetical protein